MGKKMNHGDGNKTFMQISLNLFVKSAIRELGLSDPGEGVASA